MGRQILLLPLLLLAAVAAAAPAWAQDSAKQLLERMIKATRTLNYEGTFAYIQGQDVDVMALIHSNEDGHERQRMYSLSGARREVLVQNNQVTCLLPDRRLAIKIARYTRSPFPISFPSDLDTLKPNYRFRMEGTDRVVNRQTRIVGVVPRDHFRYGYKLWLDNGTGLVLRSALVNRHDHYLEQLIFTRFQLKSHIDPAALNPSISGMPSVKMVTEPGDESDSDSEPDWSVSKVPPGFQQVMYQQPRTADASGPLNEQVVFSDGLATVSVFVEQFKGKPLLRGASRIDAMNAYGVILDKRFQVLAVGEVPPETVHMIATSTHIKPSDK